MVAVHPAKAWRLLLVLALRASARRPPRMAMLVMRDNAASITPMLAQMLAIGGELATAMTRSNAFRPLASIAQLVRA